MRTFQRQENIRGARAADEPPRGQPAGCGEVSGRGAPAGGQSPQLSPHEQRKTAPRSPAREDLVVIRF